MHKIVMGTLIGLAVATAGSLAYYNNLVKQVQDRFPDLDPNRVRKAYANFMTKSLAGKYGPDIDNYSDKMMDHLFMIEYDLTK